MHCHTQCSRPCSRPVDPHLRQRLLDTHGSLGQSPVGSLLLPPGSWCAQGSVCALKSLFPQSCVSSGGSMVGLIVTSSKRAYAIPRSASPRAPDPAADYCCPYFRRRPSNTVLAQSLWDLWVLVCTRFLWALCASLVGKGFDSKHDFAPPTVLLCLLLCPWKWSIFFWWDPTFSSRWVFSNEL